MDNSDPQPAPPGTDLGAAPAQGDDAPGGPPVAPSSEATAEPPAREPAAEPAAAGPSRDEITALIDDAVQRITAIVQTRTKAEAFQQDLITRLHNDLQDQVNRSAVLPVVTSMLRLQEEMEKVAERLSAAPDELTPEHMRRQFAEFAEDLGTLVEQAGVVRFVDEAQGDQFNGTRQSLLSRVPTADPALNLRIAARVRPGADFGKTLLRREAVRVYVYDPSRAAPLAAQPSNSEGTAP